MPARLDINTKVEAPVDDLFDLMADPETEEHWNPDALEVRRLDHWTFTLAPDGTATQLVAAAELRPKGAMRLLSPLFGPMMRRTFSQRPAQLAAGVAKQRSVAPT